jgi:hypothetical protein
MFVVAVLDIVCLGGCYDVMMRAFSSSRQSYGWDDEADTIVYCSATSTYDYHQFTR